MLRIDTAGGPVGDLLLPLFGEHMAQRAALAVAAVEAFLGGASRWPSISSPKGWQRSSRPLGSEVVRRSPTVLLDTCHNPHGARATIAAVTEAFAFTPLIGVVAVMADKDVSGLLEVFADEMTTIVCTTIAGTDRALSPDAPRSGVAEVFGPDRVRWRCPWPTPSRWRSGWPTMPGRAPAS